MQLLLLPLGEHLSAFLVLNTSTVKRLEMPRSQPHGGILSPITADPDWLQGERSPRPYLGLRACSCCRKEVSCCCVRSPEATFCWREHWVYCCCLLGREGTKRQESQGSRVGAEEASVGSESSTKAFKGPLKPPSQNRSRVSLILSTLRRKGLWSTRQGPS